MQRPGSGAQADQQQRASHSPAQLPRLCRLTPQAQVIRKEDKCMRIDDKFGVVVVTKFRAADYAAFLGEETLLELMQPVQVICEAP
jgi:hypothetical protein